ncbi:hypothetical protein YC2023_009427 [Brassica napus]
MFLTILTNLIPPRDAAEVVDDSDTRDIEFEITQSYWLVNLEVRPRGRTQE